jgi:hypothetical protein
MERTHYSGYAALAATALLAGCSGGGDTTIDSGTSLSVSLMDAPVDGVTQVNVKIESIAVKPSGGPAFDLPLVRAPFNIDLLAHTDQNAALLIDEAAVPAGSYEWLRMNVSAEFDGVYDSYVMTAVGGQEELRVPSGVVRLVSGFEVEANRALRLLFDWDLRKGLVNPPGQPGYLLKPAFRVMDVSTYGVLKGTIAMTTLTGAGDPNGCLADDADVAIGNVVYVFAGSGVVPDDIDTIDPEPVATAVVAQNAAGDFVYRMLLEPGEYTVAFTCQAANDDPETDQTGSIDEIEFLPTVNRTVTGSVDEVADF